MILRDKGQWLIFRLLSLLQSRLSFCEFYFGEDIINQMPGIASDTQMDSEIANVFLKCRF